MTELRRHVVFVPSNAALGNVYRDILITRKLLSLANVRVTILAPSSTRDLPREPSVVFRSYPAKDPFAVQVIYKELSSLKPDLVIADQSYQIPPLCRILGLSSILIAQPYPIQDQNFDSTTYRLGFESAGAILMPMAPQFITIPPDIEGFASRIEMIGPITDIPAKTKEEVRSELCISSTDRLITVTAGGGSLGFLNFQTVLEAFENSPEIARNSMLFLHAGILLPTDYFDRLRNRIATSKFREKIRIERYVENLASLIAASDLVVCHAGNVMFEASLLRVPRIVVPLELSEHLKLALVMEKLGAAEVIFPKDLSSALLSTKIQFMLEENDYNKKMIESGLAIADGRGAERAARAIVNFLNSLA